MSVFTQAQTDTKQEKLTWTLEQCVEYALSNNLNVQDQIIGEKRATNTFNQDKLDRYPVLNASASHNYNFGRTIDPFTNQFVNRSIQSNNFSLTSSVTVYNGSRITQTIKRSENEVMRSKLQTEAIQNQIGLSVADAFLQIIFAENQLKNFQEINKSTVTQLKQAKALYEGGATNQSQYLTLKAQDARDQMNIQSARGNIRTAYVRLKQIMQLDHDNFEIVIPEFERVPSTNNWSLAGVLINAENTIPDLQLAKSQWRTAQLNEGIAKSNLYPRVNLFANVNSLYSETRLEQFNPQSVSREIGYVEGTNEAVITEFTTYSTKVASFGQQLGDNFGQAAGVSVSVPIFNNNQAKANIEDAKLATQISKNNIDRTAMNMKSDIIQAYTDYENALASYNAAVENEKAQKENYDFAVKLSEAGASTPADMILALNEWSRAKIDVERARYQLVFSNTVLHYYNTGEISITL
jgi:outer membrane protein